LLLNEIEGSPRQLNDDERARAASLLFAVYGEPGSGIAVLSENSEKWESITFALWSQQWPRLRRSFCFSTGSFGDRRTGGITFDLQIAPITSQRLWEASTLPTYLLPIEPSPVPSPPAWVHRAVEDLQEGSSGSLRRFLFKYGSDIEQPRESFPKLVESFTGPASTEEDPNNRLAQLAAAFPNPAEAVTLKRDQLSAAMQAPESELFQSLAAAHFLLRAQAANAFASVPVDFGSQGSNLWRHKRADVLALLGALQESERSEAFRKAIALALSPEDIPTLWREQHRALPHLLAHNPRLATFPSAWMLPQTGQRAVWESLRSATSDPQTWASICTAMLQAQCAFLETETVELAGEALTHALEQWLRTEGFRLPSYAWREALRPPLTNVIQSDGVRTSLLALATWALPASRARSISGKRADVQLLATAGLAELPNALALPTLFWLTALGFQTPGEEGLNLLSRGFFKVYDAVATSSYPGEAWDLLAPILPELFLGLDWDRCKRLRLAMSNWLAHSPSLGTALAQTALTKSHASLIHSLR
jgi:hypothetical protein